MKLHRQSLAALGAAALLTALMAAPGGAAGPINGVGKGKCAISGTIKFNPPLKNGGTAAETVTVAASLSGCSGTGAGATIASGTSTGSEHTPTNSCSALVGTMHNTLTTIAKWTVKAGKPALNPTTVVFTTETGNATNPPSFDTSGKATAGSFKGDTAKAHAVIQESITTIATECGGTGVSLLHIVKTGSTSTLS
jgi:hypothetical protein